MSPFPLLFLVPLPSGRHHNVVCVYGLCIYIFFGSSPHLLPCRAPSSSPLIAVSLFHVSVPFSLYFNFFIVANFKTTQKRKNSIMNPMFIMCYCIISLISHTTSGCSAFSKLGSINGFNYGFFLLLLYVEVFLNYFFFFFVI